MQTVLVLGGYGTFGGRIVRLLAAQRRWRIVVAGRSQARAEAFVRELGVADIAAAAVDRESGLADALRSIAPFLVIDASGPFQGQAAQDYPVVRAALAAGAHYIDISDALDFVRDIGRLDDAAKARGLTVIAGASSVPTLSSAVIAELARDLDAVLEIEIAISSSNQATLGRSVHAALLSYAGKPIRIRRFGAATAVPGLQGWVTTEIAVPGHDHLRRLVAPCEVPDLALLPQRYPALRKLVFRAGTELGLLNRAAGLMARLVSWRWLDSLAPFAALAGSAFGLLRGFGSTRSGMVVDVRGRRDGEPVARRWCVIAEQGDGLWVPALAAALLAEKLDRGELAPGARPGIDVLTKAEFRAAFAGKQIFDSVTEIPVPPSPFRQWLGALVDRLPPPVRVLHDDLLERGASGRVTVTRGRHPLAALMCRMLGFPESATDRPLRVEFEPHGGSEIWRRRFGASTFTSVLRPWPGRAAHVRECVGPFDYGFEFVPDQAGLRMEFRGWWCCGIPLPRALGPQVAARLWAADGRYHFSVDVAARGIGPVIAYRGALQLEPALEVRPVREADLDALAEVAGRSYRAAFGASMSAEDAAAYIAETRSADAFRRALATDVILVAEEGSEVRGYVQFGPVTMPDVTATERDRELRALYLDPPYQGRGIGRRLLAAALAHPVLRDAGNVYLDVWIRNTGARRLYERHGFQAIGERRFTLPSGEAGDPDVIMARRRASSPVPGEETAESVS